MLVAMAWRNLWRNPRRTLLTLAAVAGGLAAMLAQYGLTRAIGDRLIEGLTGSYLGHVQIHREGYREKRSSTRTVRGARAVLEAVRGTAGIAGASGRVYGFAHATFVRGRDAEVRRGGGRDVASPVVALLGIEPDHESDVTDIATRVVQGRWIEGETDVVIGQGVATRHELQVGDAFLPTAVDSTGAVRGPWAVSDRVPRVVGIARTGIQPIDDQMVLMSLSYLAELLRMDDEVHEVAIKAERPRELEPLVGAITASVARARDRTRHDEALPATRPLRITSVVADDTAAEARLVGVDVTCSRNGTSPRSPAIAAGRFLERAEDIVLSQRLATAAGVVPGAAVTVSVPVACGPDVPAAECPPSDEPFVVAGILSSDEVLSGGAALVLAPVLSDNIAALAPEVMAPLTDDERRSIMPVLERVRGEVSAEDEVLAWTEIAPEMEDMLRMMDVGPLIFLIIFYIAVMLGIVNTMLMATFERTRELGLMKALGMRPRRVVALVMTESAMLAAVGVLIGLLIGSGIFTYWSFHGMDLGVFMGERQTFDMSGVTFDPVLWPRVTAFDVLASSLTVATMTTLAGLWPAIRASRLHPTEALRYE